MTNLAEFPPEHRAALRAFPPALLALLAAELRVGNALVEVGAGFPAPPAGSLARLAGPIRSRPRASGDGLHFDRWPNGGADGGFTDAVGHYFVVEPPAAPPPLPDMDEIRRQARGEAVPVRPVQAPRAEPDRVERFRASMVMNYDRWHDGTGLDLGELDGASPDERKAIVDLILRGPDDERTVEALAAIGGKRAAAELRRRFAAGRHNVRLAIVRDAGDVLKPAQRAAAIAAALREADFFDGFGAALDLAADWHPPEVVEALLAGALGREGPAACSCASMLLFVHGVVADRHDMTQRSYWLQFHAEEPERRWELFVDLCGRIGVDPAPWRTVQ